LGHFGWVHLTVGNRKINNINLGSGTGNYGNMFDVSFLACVRC